VVRNSAGPVGTSVHADGLKPLTLHGMTDKSVERKHQPDLAEPGIGK